MPRKNSGSAGQTECTISPGETLDGKDYFQYMRTVLKGRNDPVWFMSEILGNKLFPVQEEIAKRFYQNKYNSGRTQNKYLQMCCGMRSGKSALASMMMAYEFFDICTLENPSAHYGLLKNQKIFIIGVATSTELAEDGIYSNMYNMLECNEWFDSWTDTDFYKGRINCNDKHVHAEVLGSWANTAVGRTSKLVVFDELDLFEQSESRRGAWEIYTRLSKSTATLGLDGHVVACSSPQTPTGIMMTLYKQGLRTPHTVAVLYKSWEMNPNLSEEDLKAEYRAKGDMGAFYRDFACAPEMTGGMQFPEGVRMVNMTNVLRTSLINRTSRSRVMAIDPAVKNDGFGMACGYQDGHSYVVDGTIKFMKDDGASYIKPSDIWAFMETAIPKLNINALVFDTWMFPEIIERVEEKFGITAEKHIVEKEDYDRWRELQEDRSEDGFSVTVVEDLELKREAEDLLVINNPRKPKVDHPYSGSKDIADCVANCLWYMDNFEMENVTPMVLGFQVV